MIQFGGERGLCRCEARGLCAEATSTPARGVIGRLPSTGGDCFAALAMTPAPKLKRTPRSRRFDISRHWRIVQDHSNCAYTVPDPVLKLMTMEDVDP